MDKDHKNTQWRGLGGPQNSVISSGSSGLIYPRLSNSFKLNGLSSLLKDPLFQERHTPMYSSFLFLISTSLCFAKLQLLCNLQIIFSFSIFNLVALYLS